MYNITLIEIEKCRFHKTGTCRANSRGAPFRRSVGMLVSRARLISVS